MTKDADWALEMAMREIEKMREKTEMQRRWTHSFSMAIDGWEADVADLLNEAKAAGVELEMEHEPYKMVMKVWPKGMKEERKIPQTYTGMATIGATYKAPKPKTPEKPPQTIDIAWLQQATEKAHESAAFIRLEIETKGVTVIGEAGDRVCSHTITWQALDKANVNPLFLAIEHVERELDGDGDIRGAA